MHARYSSLWSLGSAVFCLLAGCGGGPNATVSGSVTVDGQPVAKGVIVYAPDDDKGVPATATIENGQYTLQTFAGKKRVQISAPTGTKKIREYNDPSAPFVEISTGDLPPRFNRKTELTFEVHPGGNTKNWELDTKSKP